jgi:predicted DNA-binding WGR domain protein
VDTVPYYANPAVAERCVTQPDIPRAFGCRIPLVLTRDWYAEPQAVLDRLIRLTRGEAEPALGIEDDAPAPPPANVAETERVAPICPTETPAATSNALRLEIVAGTSAKFREVAQDSTTITVRYVRIGTNGQTQTKTFDTPERAAREREKLTAETLRKGYQVA